MGVKHQAGQWAKYFAGSFAMLVTTLIIAELLDAGGGIGLPLLLVCALACKAYADYLDLSLPSLY